MPTGVKSSQDTSYFSEFSSWVPGYSAGQESTAESNTNIFGAKEGTLLNPNWSAFDAGEFGNDVVGNVGDMLALEAPDNESANEPFYERGLDNAGSAIGSGVNSLVNSALSFDLGSVALLGGIVVGLSVITGFNPLGVFD